MMSLVECCKNVPADIFGAIDSWLKQLGNLLIFHFFSLKNNHRNIQMLQLLYSDGSNSKEDKEELIEVEAM